MLGSFVAAVLSGFMGHGGAEEAPQKQEVIDLLSQYYECRYSDEQRDVMAIAMAEGTVQPFPLVFCEGQRDPSFTHAWLQGQKSNRYLVRGQYWVDETHGAALVTVRTKDWHQACDSIYGHVGDCSHVIYGQNVMTLSPLEPRDATFALQAQQQMAKITRIPLVQDSMMITMTRNSLGELDLAWEVTPALLKARSGLAEKVGEVVSHIPVHYYDQQYWYLEPETLDENYEGVFYLTSGGYTEFVSRPQSRDYAMVLAPSTEQETPVVYLGFPKQSAF